MRFEEQYQDVLQNLEYGVMEVYREHSELTDYDVMDAYAALRRHYIREERGQEAVAANLTERAQKVFSMVMSMCEIRLGRGKMTTADGEPFVFGGRVLTANEIVDCIKRLERSVQRWNKSGGRQGYVKFVAQFFS